MAAIDPIAGAEPLLRDPSRDTSAAWRRALRHPSAVIGGTLLLLFIAIAALAPLLAPHDPYAQDLTRRFVNPVWGVKGGWDNPLGTDGFGRDYLSRLIYGARISLLIGFSAIAVSGLIGTTLGVAGGYFGGRVDAAVSFVITTRLSLPIALVATAMSALAGSTLLIVIAVIGGLLWDRFAVVSRSATMQARGLDYVVAARAIGCSTWRIVVGEILPNLAPLLLVVAALEMAHAVLLEAALSFLGLGVQAPLPSWGLMIADGKAQMLFKPWVIAVPGSCLFVLILAISLLGDGLRDIAASDTR
jgi:peptide/nickel transport system permease protein